MRRAARLGASRSRSPGGSVGAGSPLPGKRGDRHAPRGHRGTARDRPPQRGADGRTDDDDHHHHHHHHTGRDGTGRGGTWAGQRPEEEPG